MIGRALLCVAALVVVAAGAATAREAHARAGDLDRSFGSSGRVLTPFPGNSRVQAIERRKDGRLVVFASGVRRSGGGGALVRYRRSGELDRSFGDGGKVRLDLGGQDLLLRPDGTLVLLRGGTELVGYRGDGSRDPAFGAGRPVTVPFRAARLGGVSDGGVVAVGYRDPDDGGPSSEVFVARYRPDGSLDESFAGGVVRTALSDSLGAGEAEVEEVLVQPDGKVVVSATFFSAFGRRSPTVLLRYRPNGSLDTSFGGDGRVELPVHVSTEAPMARLPDGRFIVAGNEDVESAVVLRVRSSGALDRSFGRRGKVVLRVRPTYNGVAFPFAVAVARGGGIFIGGEGAAQSADAFVITALTPRGSLARGFGRQGSVSTRFRRYVGVRLEALFAEPNGRLTAAGGVGPGVGLARYRTGP